MSLTPVIENGFSGLASAVRETGIPLHRVLVIGDSNTMPLFEEPVKNELVTVFQKVYTYAFPAGEEYKNLDSIRKVLLFLMENHFDRKDCIAAVGGGVVGDMAGFAAAVYLRGIPVIQIPTTLLSQIDSSIGGKTGVDFKGYKNMVGAFHMPVLVYTNPLALKSLSQDQFLSGMGEVIKSALLGDAEFYNWLHKERDRIEEKEDDAIHTMISRTAMIKVDVVRQDPEEHGIRAYLNLGHTIGHAVEKYKHFTLAHGLCVGLGVAAAGFMSWKRGLIAKADYEDIRNLLRAYGLPVTTDGIDAEEILHITKSDKKMSNGQIRFILLKSLGQACICDDVTDEEILMGIRSIMEEM